MCTVSQKRPFTVESSDEDDLLKYLDIAYRREQWPARKRRSRLRKEDMDSKHEWCLEPVSSEDQARCMNYLQEALGAEGLDETTCGVCDRLVIGRDAVRKEGSDWRFMNVLRELLGVASSDIPQRLVDQYRAPPQVWKMWWCLREVYIAILTKVDVQAHGWVFAVNAWALFAADNFQNLPSPMDFS
jgi:hypothetical protein